MPPRWRDASADRAPDGPSLIDGLDGGGGEGKREVSNAQVYQERS